MKPKKSEPRKKLSFAVDREEIEINSDWVSAVMAPQPKPRVFLGGEANNATGEKIVTDEKIQSVDENTTDINIATVADIATGSTSALAGDENSTTVALTSTRRARPRPIRRITDGLTPGQYAVYSLMYENGAPGGDPGWRTFRGGYADLGGLTGLSKRGIQNVVAELQEKRVISLEQAPGHHRSQTSVYRVPAAAAVVETWFNRGWRFAVGKSKTLINGSTVALSATR